MNERRPIPSFAFLRSHICHILAREGHFSRDPIFPRRPIRTFSMAKSRGIVSSVILFRRTWEVRGMQKRVESFGKPNWNHKCSRNRDQRFFTEGRGSPWLNCAVSLRTRMNERHLWNLWSRCQRVTPYNFAWWPPLVPPVKVKYFRHIICLFCS